MAVGAIIANNCDWHHGGCYHGDVNVNKNVNVNTNYNQNVNASRNANANRGGNTNRTGNRQGGSAGGPTEVAAGPEPLEQERHPFHNRRQQASTGLWFRRCRGLPRSRAAGKSRLSFNRQRRSPAIHRHFLG